MTESSPDPKTAMWYAPTAAAREAWEAWKAERPEHVRAVVERFPPWTLWWLSAGPGRAEGWRVYVVSFQEHDPCEHRPEHHVTITVAIDSRFNQVIFERRVFGVDPDALTPCELPGDDEPVGYVDESTARAIGAIGNAICERIAENMQKRLNELN